jgi:hypothetical protein
MDARNSMLAASQIVRRSIRISACETRTAARISGQQFAPSLGTQKLKPLELLLFSPHN